LVDTTDANCSVKSLAKRIKTEETYTKSPPNEVTWRAYCTVPVDIGGCTVFGLEAPRTAKKKSLRASSARSIKHIGCTVRISKEAYANIIEIESRVAADTSLSAEFNAIRIETETTNTCWANYDVPWVTGETVSGQHLIIGA